MNIHHQEDLLNSRACRSGRILEDINASALRDEKGGRVVPHVAKADQLWLDRLLERGLRGRDSFEETITPGRAAALLKRNPRNRALKERRIAEVADDIRHARFDLNGETIILSDEGLLNDGQNRLWACIDAGKPFVTFMVIGVSRHSRVTVDQGTARTAADFLEMENGTASPRVAAAATRMLWLHKQNVLVEGGNLPVSKATIRAEYQANETAINEWVYRIGKGKKKQLKGGYIVAAAVLLSKRNSVAAGIFMDRLIKGDALVATDPIYVLRESLMEMGRGITAGGRLELVLRHWNHWRLGKKIKNGRRLPSQNKYPDTLEG